LSSDSNPSRTNRRVSARPASAQSNPKNRRFRRCDRE
jgi:hypothetical protein